MASKLTVSQRVSEDVLPATGHSDRIVAVGLPVVSDGEGAMCVKRRQRSTNEVIAMPTSAASMARSGEM